MGFFSWKCCGCKKPVINLYRAGRDYPDQAKVVLLTENGSVIRGTYDGYGNVDSYDLTERGLDGEVRWYHDACYTGQTYAQTPDAEDDPGQGFFYDDAELRALFGPPKASV